MSYQAADTSGPSYTVEVVQSYAGDGARLDSTADYEDAAGYSSISTPLDRQQGVTIRFTLRITAEDHTRSGTADKDGDGLADRAGFSVIANVKLTSIVVGDATTTGSYRTLLPLVTIRP